MALSDHVGENEDAFESAYELTINNTPEDQLEAEFVATFTRHLISVLSRDGIEEVVHNKEGAKGKIQAALEAIHLSKGEKWRIFVKNKGLLKIALEHELASRSTLSDMPENTQKLSGELSIPPAARAPSNIPPKITPDKNPFGSKPTMKFPAVIPPADDSWTPKQ